jgi:hypothetical protein
VSIRRSGASTDFRFPSGLACAACAANVANDSDVAETQRNLLRDQSAEGPIERLAIHFWIDIAGGGGIETVVRGFVSREHRANERHVVGA